MADLHPREEGGKAMTDQPDYSLGNWLALNAGPEEIDRWNALVEYCQRANAALLAAEELAKAGDVLALRLSHVVGKEHIVTHWEEALFAFRAAMEDTQ